MQHLFAIPLVERDRSDGLHRTKAGRNCEPQMVACLLLYDRLDGQPFTEDDEEVKRLHSLPLASVLIGARDMPFRLFSQEGPFATFFAWALRLMPRMLHCSLYRLRLMVIGGMMELLRFAMLIIAIAMLLWPLSAFLFGQFGLFGRSENVTVEILGIIDKLVMMLTVILVSRWAC